MMIEEFMDRVITHAILHANNANHRTTLCKSDIEHGLRLEVSPADSYTTTYTGFVFYDCARVVHFVLTIGVVHDIRCAGRG